MLSHIRKFFSIVPQRASRFFTLSVFSSPLPQDLHVQHNTYIQNAERGGSLLMAYRDKKEEGKETEEGKFVYFFQSQNQIEAFGFYKGLPYKNLVKQYQIQEISMESRVKDKELAPRKLRE